MTRFRPAAFADEQLFYAWRQRDESGDWWHGTPTDTFTHHDWFAERLNVSTLLVWLDNGKPAGCVRIDPNGEVAFQTARDRELELLDDLKDYADRVGRKLKFTVDLDDPKCESLWRAGFVESSVRFFAYRPMQDDVQRTRRRFGVTASSFAEPQGNP